MRVPLLYDRRGDASKLSYTRTALKSPASHPSDSMHSGVRIFANRIH